jgi:SulP family sulfate permease
MLERTSPITPPAALLPNLENLKSHASREWKSDLSAGLTTAALLVPQSMAYAMLAGLPPQMGLYAATLPLAAYALFGSARTLSVGPVAMDSLLTASTLAPIFVAGSAAYHIGAMSLAALVGIALILMSALRFGRLVRHLSDAMMSGFTSAAALIIALSQLKHLLGVNLSGGAAAHEVILEVLTRLSEISPLTLSVGIGSLLVFKGLPLIAPKAPAGLIGVISATLLSATLDARALGLSTVGDIPQGLPTLSPEGLTSALRALTGPHALSMISGAVSIALLAFMEAMAIGRAVAARYGYEVRPGQELFALGVTNLTAALFGGYPVAGGFSRTAVNDRAGARTPLASLVTMTVVLLVVWRFTPALKALPHATLAAMIIGAVLGLIDLKAPREWLKSDRRRALIWAGTALVTLSLGLQLGIITGVLLSVTLRPTHTAP